MNIHRHSLIHCAIPSLHLPEVMSQRGEPVPGTPRGEPVLGTSRGQYIDVSTTDIFPPSLRKKRKGISSSSFSGSGLVISMQKKLRRRLLQELVLCRDDITPRKKRILNFTRKLQDNYRQRNKRVKSTRGKMELLKIQNWKSMNFFLHHDVTPTAAILAYGDARNRLRKLKSRRWTRQEKLFALALYRSPKAYNFLNELIALPCRSTLTVLLSSVPFDVCINHLRQEVQKMDNRDKYCALYFSKMSLRSGVYYNEPVDLVDGFEDFGTLGTTYRQADHALVFMVRSLYNKWKQPVAYYLCQSTTPTNVLKKLIVLVIRALSSVGMYIKATVCDQGPTNRSSLSELVKDFSTGRPNDNFAFQVDGELILTVFDVPHLLKSMRNNFIKYDVVTTDGTAKWEQLEILGKMNSTHLFNLIKKLTPEHLNPVGKDKRRVYYAAQVFSHSCWAGINLLINSPLQEMPTEAVVTADFLLFMNNLFDSLNGSLSKSMLTSPLRCWLTENSGHSEFWGDALKKMSNLSFVDRTTGRVSYPQCQGRLVTTIRALHLLWPDL